MCVVCDCTLGEGVCITNLSFGYLFDCIRVLSVQRLRHVHDSNFLVNLFYLSLIIGFLYRQFIMLSGIFECQNKLTLTPQIMRGKLFEVDII